MASEGKVNPGESTEISNRTNTLSFALMAEINTFHHQRVKDMKTAHQHFLQEQIAFYHKVSTYKIPQKEQKIHEITFEFSYKDIIIVFQQIFKSLEDRFRNPSLLGPL